MSVVPYRRVVVEESLLFSFDQRGYVHVVSCVNQG